MTGEPTTDDLPPEGVEPAAGATRAPRGRRLAWFGAKYGLGLPLVLLVLLGTLLLGLDTAIGHRLLADWLQSSETDTGLSMTVGRIDGSIYGTAVLEDVALRDTRGVFMRVPATEVEWRPLAWLDNRLDIRRMVLRRGVLLRVPQLRPSINGSLLPDFDVRVDRFAIERLTVAAPVLGVERKIDLHASGEIRPRRAYLSLQGRLGGGDRLAALLDDDRSRDHFALGVDYAAPKGGLLAALTGARTDRRVRLSGTGTWHKWNGSLLADGGGQRAAVLELDQKAGAFALSGQLWPAPLMALSPASTRLLGERVQLTGHARFDDRRLAGALEASSATLHATAKGEADLGEGAFHHLLLTAETHGSLPVGGGMLEGGRGSMVLDGPFATLTAQTNLSASRWAGGTTQVQALSAHGTATRTETGWRLPLSLAAGRIITGNALLDPRLTSARGSATLVLTGTHLASSDMVLTAPALAARLVLSGDVAGGVYGIAGHVASRGWQIPDWGRGDGEASLTLRLAPQGGWSFGAHLTGQLSGITNGALAQLAGDHLNFTGEASGRDGQPLILSRAAFTSERLTLAASARRNVDGTATLAGNGHHATLGSFTLAGQLAADGLHAKLSLPDPYPTGGVRDVTLVLSPESGGLRMAAAGQSLFGPFSGVVALVNGGSGPGRLDVRQFTISQTALTGSLTLGNAGATGLLTLSGGGVAGNLRLAPRGDGQNGQGEAMDLALTMTDAHFGGDQPLTVARGSLRVGGVLLRHHSTLEASLMAQGIGKGRLFLGQVSAQARLDDGVGHVAANLSGRRSSRFELALTGDLAPDAVALGAHGLFAGQAIAMPRRAVFTPRTEAEGGGWRLAPSQIDFGQGRAIASGVFGNGNQELDLALAGMPLALGDVVFADLGLGGLASGTLHFSAPREGLPSGDGRLMVKNLTRSGLVVSSRPIDVALAGGLVDDRLELRAVAGDPSQAAGHQTIGRLQASIANLPPSGRLIDRLRAGRFLAQMRFQGPADAPWRLMGLDDFDLTGPIAIAADITGSLDAPQIRGSLAGDTLHMASAETGTDITQLVARGAFAGSRLSFTTLAGHTAGGGQVNGSGSIDFSGITEGHRPALDFMLAAHKAQLATRADLALTASGPLRIVSDGLNGTIAGRLSVDNARWRLGLAQAAAELPIIATREINRSSDVAPASARHTSWRFLVDLTGRSKIQLVGLGLDSEWGADLHLRGPLRDPTLDGHADLVGGTYEFAGARFDLTRGRVIFTDSASPDPRLDIAATANITGLAATLTVHGTSLKPQIAFSSIPPLPEEEVLSRLLFGDSVTKISAPEALQLGAALASLHNGGGLDPINKVRSVIGLDRLRIVGPDPTIGRQSGVAAGKYFGRRFYAEVVSDGHGYSASNIEARLTRWLSLLGSVSTVGQQSVNLRVSKDY